MQRLLLISFVLLVGCRTLPVNYNAEFITIDQSAKKYITAQKAETMFLKMVNRYEQMFKNMSDNIITRPRSIEIKVKNKRSQTTQIHGEVFTSYSYFRTGEQFNDYRIELDPINIQNRQYWYELLRHEFRHIIWGLMTERQKSEVFAQSEM